MLAGELFLAKGPRSLDINACGPLVATGLLVRFLSDSRIEVIGQLSNKVHNLSAPPSKAAPICLAPSYAHVLQLVLVSDIGQC